MPLATISPRALDPAAVFGLHAPDGFLSVPVALFLWAIAIVAIAISVSRASRSFDERAVPLMGVTAAFIFAAQMINFPILGGTSGHLLGAVLAAILLGPWAGTLVMASVIAVQALLFQDGGLLAMGANIVNMGIVGTIGGFAIYVGLCRLFGGEERGRLPAAAIAAWTAVMLGAAVTSVELAVSGTSPLAVVLPAMLGTHIFIGIGEALITVGALALIGNARPDLLSLRDAGPGLSAALEVSET
ncbi:MAG: energy-coupling factor ABC transporter permease [Chloroflexota bacterium]|nr:energy-coupling factor ABC transporter permease [Chloroflexota bacterium]